MSTWMPQNRPSFPSLQELQPQPRLVGWRVRRLSLELLSSWTHWSCCTPEMWKLEWRATTAATNMKLDQASQEKMANSLCLPSAFCSAIGELHIHNFKGVWEMQLSFLASLSFQLLQKGGDWNKCWVPISNTSSNYNGVSVILHWFRGNLVLALFIPTKIKGRAYSPFLNHQVTRGAGPYLPSQELMSIPGCCKEGLFIWKKEDTNPTFCSAC